MKDETKKVSTNREKKQTLVAEIAKKVEKAKAIVLSDYQGLTHKQLEQLKRALKKADAEMLVTKNTLLKIALEQHNLNLGDKESEAFQNPTATIFAYSDVVLPLKELARMIKTLQLPKIKVGILEGKQITADQVTQLATLPSAEVLLAQFVGGLKSPLYGLHRSLQWNLIKLVMTLKTIESKKQ